MSISKKEWNIEAQRLEKTIEVIHKQLNDYENSIEKANDEINDLIRNYRENEASVPRQDDFDRIASLTQNIQLIKREEVRNNTLEKAINKLKKVINNPYFARIDFKEDDCEKEEVIYIGINTLIEDLEDDINILIYDWRAPICSLYYENEKGHASYKCKDGNISGDVTLKRQYKIKDSKIQYMFDSSIKIDDECLGKVLSEVTDEKMKTIVYSIQKQQNKLIRDESNDMLIIQGGAGSGKTSIALHRIAYLLYKYKDKGIKPEHIVIFSPNEIFNDYISNVLPELGEENVIQTTLLEYIKNTLGRDREIEDVYSQIEYVISDIKDNQYNTRLDNIRFKNSNNFVNIMKEYITDIETKGFDFKDIKFKKWIVISKNELEDLFYETYKKWPVKNRFEQLLLDIDVRIINVEELIKEEIENNIDDVSGYIIDPTKESEAEITVKWENFKSNINKLLPMNINIIDLYKELFSDKNMLKKYAEDELPYNIDEIIHQTLKFIESKVIKYEDAIPLVYLQNAIDINAIDLSCIKYVIIDEVQDYSTFEYHTIRQLFKKAKFTVLGDINQTVNPLSKLDSYEELLKVFKHKNPAIAKLNKSYRSSLEIFRFTKQIINCDLDGVIRHGEKPMLMKLRNDQEKLKDIAEGINNDISAGMNSIAIICKDANETLEAYNKIKNLSTINSDINLIKKEDDSYKSGVLVIPSYLSKGLEFDSVIIYNVESNKYFLEPERHLFYTICTRALHKLKMYYFKEPTPFISNIDENLYKSVAK
ncbi:AAA family ATPase [Clostridiaceae bacterium M8S5]|nr:AAA family ATPase [Clostridiaceae bacterium M8S5]